MDTSKGTFVRWTAKDEDGSFSHVGQVLADSKTGLFMLTKDGEMYVPKDDGVIEAARKPKSWKGNVVTVATAATPRKEKKAVAAKTAARKERKAPAKGKKPTKIGVAVELLSGVDQGEVSRKEMIEMVQKALGLEDNRSFAANITRDALKRIA